MCSPNSSAPKNLASSIPKSERKRDLKTGMKAVKKFIGMGEDAIVVKGVDNLLINRAQAAAIRFAAKRSSAIFRSERELSFITNAARTSSQLMVNKDRIVEVEWAKSDKEEIQSVQLLATTENRTGMLAGITNAIADIKTGIRDARANVSKDDIGLIEVTVEVFDKKHLDKVVGAIEHVPGVIAVERINAVRQSQIACLTFLLSALFVKFAFCLS